MRKNTFKTMFVFFVSVFLVVSLFGEVSGPLVKGEIIDKVVCHADPSQSYVLYLPSSYDSSANKKWPILYAFEPAARAKLPVTRFKEAAEKYGYIVVCSREARNGPAGPIHKAIAAIWQDTHERFVIDANRVYGTGFSGGARMASRLHYLTRQGCAGIIACGAGISYELKNKPQMLKPAFWYGIVGIADFNYNEVMTLDKTLDSIGVDHHVEVTETQHQWGEVDVLNRAVEWMEILAVKKGHLKKDDAFINFLYTGYLDRAGKMLADGKTFYAAAVYNSAHVLFNGLTDTSEAEKAAGQLKDSKAYKKFQKEEKARLLKEQELIKSASMALYFLENPKKIQGSPKKVIRDLNISYLLKEAKKGKDIYYKGLGKRLLASLLLQTTNRGYIYLGKKEYKKAVEFFKIGIKISKDNGPAYYDLTCAYSLMNDKKKALKSLKLAVEKGYGGYEHIKKDSDLDNIRNEKAFKDIMNELKDTKLSTQSAQSDQ